VYEERALIKGIHHIAIGVNDLDTAVDFYSSAFGFSVVQRATIDAMPKAEEAVGLHDMNANMAMLRAPNCFIELWQYYSPKARNQVSEPNDLGYPHMAIQVSDIEEEHRRLTAAGMRFVGPPVDFGDSSAVYGRDPFGNVIEIYEIRGSEKAQLVTTTGASVE
jgi:glyoxylase I family protein